MRRWIIWCVVPVLALLLGACSSVRTLKSESGLYDVELQRYPKAFMDGAWTWGEGNPYAELRKGSIYIAPLDISKVQEDQPELAPLMVDQMHGYVVQCVQKALNESNAANKTEWVMTDKPAHATVRVDMALVHFRPQRPLLRLLSSVGGLFMKIPGVSDAVGYFSKGDICIEMTVRDGKTGKLLLACKDSNSRSASLISAEAYSRTGNADANLRYWAEQLAFLVRICSHDRAGKKKLTEYIEESRSWLDVAGEWLAE